MKYLFFLAVIMWFSMYPPNVSMAENKLIIKQREINLAAKEAQIHYLKVKNSVLVFQIRRSLDSVKIALKKLK